MKIYKFGGASIRDAVNIRNVGRVLQTVGYADCLIVASAMGKTTNALEVVVARYFSAPASLDQAVQEVKDYHFQIAYDLFPQSKAGLFSEMHALFEKLNHFLSANKSPNYNFVYDQIVGYGELLSTLILHHYLESCGIDNRWTDSRLLVKTDTTYRDAQVDWELTQSQIRSEIRSQVLHITQGFIGSDPNGFCTTLGREGSDYSAAIFAFALNAESVTIWKDVPGVLNADPRYFPETTLLEHLSYQEAIELAFYGASVIHPKTLQPLQQKEIPLYVKSFINPLLPGTEVSKGMALSPQIPCFIVKKNQLLISLSSLDFSFIMEGHISEIFKCFHQHHIKVHVIQNSAISFSVCVEDPFQQFEVLRSILSKQFKVSYNEGVSLYTIRHFEEQSAERILQDKTLLLKQVNRETIQMVIKE
ncbi:aspartate kinase [Flavobacterium sp. JP2137]|uniref:aspartate kinase n=1 Tax=Flavobacterium sp. JP2137 TaxID=3414510 RepID=UPI003D2FA567